MKRLLLGLAVLAASCSLTKGQSLSLSISPSSVQAGQTATLTISYADSAPSSNTAAVEWILSLPSGVTAGSYTPGAALVSKPIDCGTAICVAAGDGATLNDTVIGSGVIATVPLTVAPGAAPGSLTVNVTGVLGATAVNPGTVMFTVGAAPTLSVLSTYDLNGDGVVNFSDVGIMLNELLGRAACAGQSLQVGDGKCTVNDLEIEIRAALGVVH